ncbi:MAG: hypothetical protein IKG97_06960, partial [Lachnospiraceae bacterium]|nr:hypothetical protein [Lachnospiraceae bacterium]
RKPKRLTSSRTQSKPGARSDSCFIGYSFPLIIEQIPELAIPAYPEMSPVSRDSIYLVVLLREFGPE